MLKGADEIEPHHAVADAQVGGDAPAGPTFAAAEQEGFPAPWRQFGKGDFDGGELLARLQGAFLGRRRVVFEEADRVLLRAYLFRIATPSKRRPHTDVKAAMS